MRDVEVCVYEGRDGTGRRGRRHHALSHSLSHCLWLLCLCKCRMRNTNRPATIHIASVQGMVLYSHYKNPQLEPWLAGPASGVLVDELGNHCMVLKAPHNI